MKTFDVFGIGNALMDILVETDDNVLIELNLNKGQAHTIDEEQSKNILQKLENQNIKLAPGGSSANTLAGISKLGGSVVFCGKIGNDNYGLIYEEKMNNDRIKTNLTKHHKPTGHAITFITPDSERTFAVHLGSSILIKKEDVFEEDLKNSKILHLEAYQIEDPELRKTCLHAINIAKKNNVKVSMDLNDAGLIKRNLQDLRDIVKEHIDILFVNEDEAKAFTNLEPEDALKKISQMCEIAVVKLGKKGSLIKKGDITLNIPIFEANAIDTTGAGDMYAAGILYSLTNNIPLNKAGKIASFAASKVVSQIGARLDKPVKEEIKDL